MKAIIVDIEGKYAVALSRKGDFVKIKNKAHYMVGCEVDVPCAASLRKNIMIKSVSIAAGFIMVMSICAGAYSYSLPYSYISIELNPSIEFTANMYNRIIDAQALNEEGNRLLSVLAYRNKTVREGIEAVLESAYEQGYLQENSDNAIVFALSGRDEQKLGEIHKEIEDVASRQLQKAENSGEVLVEQLPVEQHTDAKEQGISPGKLLLINKLKEVSPEVKVDDVKDNPVGEIIKSIKDAEKKVKSENQDKDDKENKNGLKQAGMNMKKNNKDDKDKNKKGNGNEKDNDEDNDKKNREQRNTGIVSISKPMGNTGGKDADDLQKGEKGASGEKNTGKNKYNDNDNLEDSNKKNNGNKNSDWLKNNKNKDSDNKNGKGNDGKKDKGNNKALDDNEGNGKKNQENGTKKNDYKKGSSSSTADRKGLFWWIFRR